MELESILLFYNLAVQAEVSLCSFRSYTGSLEDGHLTGDNRLLLSQVSPACFLYM